MTLKNAYELVMGAAAPEDVFGVPFNEDGLKKAFRDLSVVLHPDKHSSKPANKKLAEAGFKKLGEWREAAEHKLKNGTYGDRKAMARPVTVATKKDVYTISGILAVGDISTVYAATNKAGSAVVLKVPRSPSNNDLMKAEADRLKWLFNEAPTRKLPTMRHLPVLLDSFTLQHAKLHNTVNVYQRLEGYVSLEDVIRAFPSGLNYLDAAWMFNRILGALCVSHQAGITHGGIVPSNVMISPETHNGVLIDWKNSITISERIKTISAPYKAYYPPEVYEKKTTGFEFDTYMAATCFLKLVGGDPEKKTWPKGQTIPPQVQGIMRACWLGRIHRSSDVFDIHKEFGEATGKRRFRPFVMPTSAASGK